MQRRIVPNKIDLCHIIIFHCQFCRSNNNKHFHAIKILIAKNWQYSSKSLTKIEKYYFTITPYLNKVMIGITLGNLFISKFKKDISTKLEFEQSFINEAYLLY